MKKATLPGPHTLGVIARHNSRRHPPFDEAPFFKQLSQEGKQLGIHIITFDPKEVDWKTRTVSSWFVNRQGQWANGLRKLPSLIYDRCFYVDRHQYMNYKSSLLRISQDPHIRLLGRGLSGKWKTYEFLKQHPDIDPFLPITIKYHSPENVIDFMEKQGSALIKPNGGGHGRGVVAISKHAKGFWIRGRSPSNQPFQKLIGNETKLKTWIQQFVQKTYYIIQPYLNLTTREQSPFDIRILVQKDENRKWQTTGMAVRTGQPNFITSNLHGGGQAMALQPFLDQNYPKHLVPLILQHIRTMSDIIPAFMEKHGGPLVELGLDVGVDREGNVWLLEINSKPGRTIFTKTGELDIEKRAVQLPIYYARALLTGHLGG